LTTQADCAVSHPKKVTERPAYVVESVDNALRLLQILRDVGALRIKDAATELHIAPSTAHRLLSMLVYRGFAVQDSQRVYHPGPGLEAGPAANDWTLQLTARCRPHMQALVSECNETVNLVIRVGDQVRFLWSELSTELLRVGDRRGQVFDAELTAAGRILLAELPPDALEHLYLQHDEPPGPEPRWRDRRMPAHEFERLRDDLAAVRAAGFAVNVGRTEEGVAVFGTAIRNPAGKAVAALAVAVPVTRFQRHVEGTLVSRVRRTAHLVTADIGDLVT
jgi:DNA-binding IclR family transcriptional regulator